MTTEAQQIVEQAKRILASEHDIEKDLTLERFQSMGRGLNAQLKAGVGTIKGELTILEGGEMKQIYKHKRQYEVEINVPMAENPGFDLVPDPMDSRHKQKVHWADVPIVERAARVLVNAILEKQPVYDKLLAEHDAKKAAEKKETPAEAKSAPAVEPADEKEALIAQAQALGIDAKRTWGVPKLAAAIAEARESALPKDSHDPAASDDDFLGGPVEGVEEAPDVEETEAA